MSEMSTTVMTSLMENFLWMRTFGSTPYLEAEKEEPERFHSSLSLVARDMHKAIARETEKGGNMNRARDRKYAFGEIFTESITPTTLDSYNNSKNNNKNKKKNKKETKGGKGGKRRGKEGRGRKELDMICDDASEEEEEEEEDIDPEGEERQEQQEQQEEEEEQQQEQ